MSPETPDPTGNLNTRARVHVRLETSLSSSRSHQPSIHILKVPKTCSPSYGEEEVHTSSLCGKLVLVPGVEGFVDRIFTGEVSGQSRAYRGSKYHQS
jgi:hypothetical protein